MENIAVIVCQKMTYECAAVGCFEAFHKRDVAFADYEEDVCLIGLFHCNGCDKDLAEELGYKIQQLKKRKVAKIHMALCIEVECARYQDIRAFLEEQGFQVVKGTH